MNDKREGGMLYIANLESGMAYLSGLMLANPLMAEKQLDGFLDALLKDPPDAGVMFQLLEAARAPLCFVEEELARTYHNKAVPLSDGEEAVFVRVVGAWRKMARAYALCASLEEPATDDAGYQALVATILHRCI